MKQYHLIILIISSCIVGILSYAYFSDWIIIRSPLNTSRLYDQPVQTVKKETVTLFYRHQNTWKSEKTTLIWPKDTTLALKYLLDTWLTFMDEEKFMKHKVTLQSVIIAPNNQDTYISFDRTPFYDQASTMEKWLWVEALLKTVRENNITLNSIRFLVHHQPMNDYHLDFSNSWPICGFMEHTKA